MRLEIRRLISYSVIVAIIMSLFISDVSAKPFSDVSLNNMDRPYIDGINYVSDRNIMNGTGTTTFSPFSGASRAMVIVTLFRLSEETGDYSNVEFEFYDVPPNAYYYNAVKWAVQAGITTGTSQHYFSPNLIVTWEQLFTFFYRYAQYKPELPDNYYDIISDAQDYSSVSTYAHEALRWAYTYGLLIRSSGPYWIYPNADLDRMRLALFLSRLRRNVEGIKWDRDKLFFRNRPEDLISSGYNQSFGLGSNGRYLLSDADWSRLVVASQNNTNIINSLTQRRVASWRGSCYGFSLVVALHNYGKINASGNCAISCNSLYEIVPPSNFPNAKHLQVTDNLYYPPTCITFSDIESKISMYQLSQFVPALESFVTILSPSVQLPMLLSGQMHSGIGSFVYNYIDDENVSHKHSVLVYGRPLFIYGINQYRIKLYDPNYNSKDSYIELNSSGTSGSIVKIENNSFVSRTNINNCKYLNDFSAYDSLLDFDNYYNSTGSNTLNCDFMQDYSSASRDQLNTTIVDNNRVSLDCKTVIYVDSYYDFQIKNEDGQILTCKRGLIDGSMNIYGLDILPCDENSPGTYAFLVDDSNSFSCSALDKKSSIICFSVIGGKAAGCTENMDESFMGWREICIDDTGRVLAISE